MKNGTIERTYKKGPQKERPPKNFLMRKWSHKTGIS